MRANFYRIATVAYTRSIRPYRIITNDISNERVARRSVNFTRGDTRDRDERRSPEELDQPWSWARAFPSTLTMVN